MFKINRVEIDGFWGTFNLRANLDDSVNIFIGRNGSGKTTFINFLEASLTADLELLESLQFDEIRLILKSDTRIRKLSITRKHEAFTYDKVTYKIGRNVFRLPLITKDIDYRRRRLSASFTDTINEVRDCLSKLVNISWLSVHRELLEDEYRDPSTRRSVTERNPIDRRIDDLSRRFTRYQLQLQSDSNVVSDSFRKKVLASMLYNEKFDKFTEKQESTLDLKIVKDGLYRTYTDLRAIDTDVEKRIDTHINRISKSVEALKNYQKTKEGLLVDDILPLSLLRRTQHIVELSTKAEQEKKEIFKPVNTYIEILSNFIEDKLFEFEPSLSSEIIVTKGETKLPLEQLSSGEKQLFILLTEALLQKGQPYVFIADEPELSLHIGWQRQILSSIGMLNPNSQIVVATHSPELAGSWRKNIINMEDIIHDY